MFHNICCRITQLLSTIQNINSYSWSYSREEAKGNGQLQEFT
jgi:hypothetical protein